MIRLDDISKKFGNTIILEEIRLEANRNEILILAGPSGCGKTTILRIIAGFEIPDAGHVCIDDKEVSNPRRILEPYKRNISMIFQDLALWPHMTAIKHITFVMENNGLPKNDRRLKSEEILESVGLKAKVNRYPHQLSGGEQQRLAIARAIGSRSAYLLMDEPFSSLDRVIKDELLELIAGIKNRLGLGIIYVTHNVQEAIPIADKIAVMNHGKIIRMDTTAAMRMHPKDDWIGNLLRI